MVDADVKRLAYATMDDALSFDVVLAEQQPAGELVIELARAATVNEMRPVARLVRKMAKTFFAAKLGEVSPMPEEGPVGLYLVAQLPELDAESFMALSEEGDLELLDD